MSTQPDQSATILFSAVSSRVTLRDGILECSSSLAAADGLLLMTAATALVLAPLAFLIPWIDPTAPESVRGQGLVAFAVGMFLLGLYVRRRRGLGTYRIDTGARTITATDGRTWTFQDVVGVSVHRDWADATQLDAFPPMPHKCMAETRAGDVLCLARGNGKRMRPFLDALTEAGLPVRTR